MVLCLLARESHGDTAKLHHEETVRGPEIAISPEKSEIFGQDPEKKCQYSLLLQGGRQRLLFDGLVLQEDVVVRGRCFRWLIRRRGRTGVRSFTES